MSSGTSGTTSGLSGPSGGTGTSSTTAVAFALTPAQAVTGLIDYATSEGQKLYKSATAALTEEGFGLDAADLKVFLETLSDRAFEHDFKSILDIPEDASDPSSTLHNLVSHHGKITLQQIRTHAQNYVSLQTREAQKSHQLYTLLMASLTKKAKQRVSLHRSEYTISGVRAGAALLKIIIRESHIDTNATTRHVRENLSKLDAYLPTVGHDILKLNEYAKLMVEALESRGETTQDLLANLFKGYTASSDKHFCAYIKRKQDEFDEGGDITADKLMLLAANKYKTMVEDGVYNKPSAEEEKIIALQAQIKKLAKNNKKNDKKDKDVKTKGDGSKAKDKGRKKKPDWMLRPPTPNEVNKSKKVNGKEYWWCTALSCWARHHPNDCRASNQTSTRSPTTTDAPDTSTSGNSNNNDGNNPAMRLSNALQSVVTDDE